MNFTDALLLAHTRNLELDNTSHILGLGVSYPGGADGTTKGLGELYPNRVLDVPVSENAVTGMAVGMAIEGVSTVVHHGRIEFAFLAFDHILTQAPKWRYMLGEDEPLPVTFRICIGRQWGNGPQHTANYHSIFLQCPGLAVYIPHSPASAAHCLFHAVANRQPAIFLEHRWLYKTQQSDMVPTSLEEPYCPRFYTYAFDKSSHNNLIVTYADGAVDALIAAQKLNARGASTKVCVINYFPTDTRTLDLDHELPNEGGNIIYFETGPKEFSLLSNAASLFFRNKAELVKRNEINVSTVFQHVPTSYRFTSNFYPTSNDIIAVVDESLMMSDEDSKTFDDLHLPPNLDFGEYRVQGH